MIVSLCLVGLSGTWVGAQEDESSIAEEIRTPALRSRISTSLERLNAGDAKAKLAATRKLEDSLYFLRERGKLPDVGDRADLSRRMIAAYEAVPSTDTAKSDLKKAILSVLVKFGDGRVERKFLLDSLDQGPDDHRWVVVADFGSPSGMIPRPERFKIVDDYYKKGKLTFEMWIFGLAGTEQAMARPVLRKLAASESDVARFAKIAERLLYCGQAEEIPFVLARVRELEPKATSFSPNHPFFAWIHWRGYAEFLRRAEDDDLALGVEMLDAYVTGGRSPMQVVLERDLLAHTSPRVRRATARLLGHRAKELEVEPDEVAQRLAGRLAVETNPEIRASIDEALRDVGEGKRRQERLKSLELK